MKKVAIYARVSTPDQCIESQLYELREMAARRPGCRISNEYTDIGSGSKARRAGLDAMLHDAHKGEFEVIMVASFDRLARSVKHFLALVDELNELGIEIVSAREHVNTSDAKGQMFVTLISNIAELERSLVVERIKAGMRRRRLEGYPLGRARLSVDHESLVRDRQSGMSLTKVAKKYGVSRASVVRFSREAKRSEAAPLGDFRPEPVLAPAGCFA
jgi:DNA invertase Pin-like site-specific DNA recombinase